jgi:hypothetical protein
LHTTGWCSPPNNIEFFLATLFESTRANGGTRAGLFDAAFLLTRYRSEFTMLEIPAFMRRVMPVVYFVGKALGRYAKYKDAPEPRRA